MFSLLVRVTVLLTLCLPALANEPVDVVGKPGRTASKIEAFSGYEMTCSDNGDCSDKCTVVDRASGAEVGAFEGYCCFSYSDRQVDMDGDGRMELFVEGGPICGAEAGNTEIRVFYLTRHGVHSEFFDIVSALAPIEWKQVGRRRLFYQSIAKGNTVEFELLDGKIVRRELVKKYPQKRSPPQQLRLRDKLTPAKAPAAVTGWWSYANGTCRPLSFNIEGSTIFWGVPQYGDGTIISVSTVGTRHTLETSLVGEARFLSMWPVENGIMAFGVGETVQASLQEQCQAVRSK
jgi:hypothetical protein